MRSITKVLRKRYPSTIPEADEAFRLLKDKSTSVPLLRHPDLTQHFFVEADTSEVGRVLSQERSVHRPHASNCLFFFKLLRVEQNYSVYTITKRELPTIKLRFQ